MTKLEQAAMQQALDVLKDSKRWCLLYYGSREVGSAIHALEAALSEPQHELVDAVPSDCSDSHQPQSEQGLWLQKTWELADALAKHLSVSPPQRQPLSDEEISRLWSWSMTAEAERTANTQQHAFARAIERAHGIRGDK